MFVTWIFRSLFRFLFPQTEKEIHRLLEQPEPDGTAPKLKVISPEDVFHGDEHLVRWRSGGGTRPSRPWAPCDEEKLT